MHNEPKIPALRFPGFDGIWTEKKFGEVFSFQSTNSLSRENLNYETGVYRNIHYGDIHKKFHSLFDITKEEVPYINENIALKNVTENFLCKEGDLLFADASEDYDDIGKCIEIVNTNHEQIVAGLHTIHARPESFVLVIGFSAHLFKSEKIKSQIKLFAQGIKVLSISTGRLSEIILSLPSLPEQTKIASFLTVVDDKIHQFTREKELLELYKKGVMQKIFSREIRFRDENGQDYPEWGSVRGKNLFESHSNKEHNGDLPILAATQDKGMVYRNTIGMEIMSSEESVRSYKIVERGDFVISLRSFQGGIEYSYFKGICSPAYVILKPKVRLNEHFYRHYFKKEDFITRLSKTVVGIRDGKQISYEAFSGLKLPFPTFEEQQKIASFFSAIDQKIKLVNTQLEKLQTWKKGLLQQLFV